MLVLTRRTGESLMIGERVTVTVLGVKGSQVRVGIVAPKDVSVDREEIRERKAANDNRPEDGATLARPGYLAVGSEPKPTPHDLAEAVLLADHASPMPAAAHSALQALVAELTYQWDMTPEGVHAWAESTSSERVETHGQ